MERFKIADQLALRAAIKEWFEAERGLIDVWIFDTRTEDWQKMLDFFSRVSQESQYTVDGESRRLPTSADEALIAGQSAATCMSIKIDGIIVNSHFFCREEIDFDINPREVKEAYALQHVLDLFRGLSDVLNKDVVIAPEGSREFSIFRLKPGSDVVEYRPSAEANT